MKFLILHGTSASHKSNWFPWLKEQLEELGHEVWTPDLPDADRPNIPKYNGLLLNQDFDYSNSVIIGHSSGAVAIFGLLGALPENVKINAAILVGAFTKRMTESPSWEMLKELFDVPFDYQGIRQKSKKFIFVHSDDDPYCPIEQAEFLSEKLEGEMHRFTGMGHFSKALNPRFDEFPELLDIIKQKVLA